MIAAIYARKSTEQHAEGDDRSVARQVANARAFAQARGWTVTDVFVDDGVSGAAGLDKLRAKARLLDLINDGPPFDVLITQSNDRLSRRDGDEAFGELKDIAQQGVEIWFYADGTRFEYGTFATNTMGFLRGEFAAEYRRAIAAKTHEALARRAQFGHVAGGRTFGYDNVRVNSHVERRINDAEAAIVLAIHEQYARGDGFRVIARALNDKVTPSPRANGWDAGTVRAIVGRPIYQGQIVWNTTQKQRAGNGNVRLRPRDEAEHVVVEAAHLRIIPAPLAGRVERRRSERKKRYIRGVGGRLLGRPSSSSYLLDGWLRCPCGAVLEGAGGMYVCRKRPDCSHELALSVQAMDEAVLSVLEGQVLGDTLIEHCLAASTLQQDGKSRRPTRELRTALEQRIADWRRAVRGKGVAEARQVISGVVELPIDVRADGFWSAVVTVEKLVGWSRNNGLQPWTISGR